MPRALTPAFLAALAEPELFPALLVRGEFDTGNLLLWTGYGVRNIGGEDYTGTGNLLDIEPVDETSAIQSNGAKFTLAGISSQAVSLALGEPYQGRRVEILLALFNSSWELIDDPSVLFSGRADVMAISDGADLCTIVMTAESRLVDLQRARIRRYENEDQKIEYPGDRGFEFVSVIQDVPLKWGTG
ncbi:hypothetical protein [uncultured Alsobacter sp.]|uniref:hypothetical protein n=1 Tax=uncultured Alsobacter sp. TaxID=1748258 RepID=UPI0025F093BB|nr:hypothetical protein [uncultured Alsobacter sp.]